MSMSQTQNMSFGEQLKVFASRHQGRDMPPNLSTGVLMDQVYAVAPSDLNVLLFSPASDFPQSLAEMQGITDLDVQQWRLENDGEVFKRVLSYTKSATKQVKAVKTMEDVTYLKADGDMYAVLSVVATLEALFTKNFRLEVLTCIMPAEPKLTDVDERSSRLVISWRLYFVVPTIFNSMLENGAREEIKENFSHFSKLLAQLLPQRRKPYSPPVSLQELVTNSLDLLHAPNDLETMSQTQTRANMSFGELLKVFATRHQGRDMPPNLSTGVLIDQVYAVAPSDLNMLIFSPTSDFPQLLAEMLGTTDLDVQQWRLENDGEVFKRALSYTKAATEQVKANATTEDMAYLKADGDMYAVLSVVTTLEALFAEILRLEVLTCIMPAEPELKDLDERSSRLVISWGLYSVVPTIYNRMLENGTRKELEDTFSHFSELLARLLPQRRRPYSPPVSLQELVTNSLDLLHAPIDLETMLMDDNSRPHHIPLHDLKEITDNFSEERIVGQGGFGVVYKGVLRNGKTIAVKKIVSSLMPGLQKQFESEVYHLMMLKHPNIVRCIGYCYETRNECLEFNGSYVFAEMAERLLCLEYLHKGSLDNYLSDETSGFDWITRYNIIEGICHGLCHLHEKIDKPIIHLDLKPANILLDDSLVPKITDFGLSRLFGQQQTICTSSCAGTLGYMAPEFLHGGIITPKLDIFSLGVIMMEIITGHRDYPGITGTSADEFIELTLGNWRNVLQRSPAYGSLEMACHQIKRCIQVGLMCVNPDRTKRPLIAKIINMLQGSESIDCNINCEAA